MLLHSWLIVSFPIFVVVVIDYGLLDLGLVPWYRWGRTYKVPGTTSLYFDTRYLQALAQIRYQVPKEYGKSIGKAYTFLHT